MNSVIKKYVHWIPPVVWASLIFWLSNKSQLPEPSFWLPPFTDKIIHAGIFAILSCLLYPAFRTMGSSRWQAAVFSMIVSSLYGITDEWHQSMVANRTPDLFDWVADTIGGSFVFLLAWFRPSTKYPC